MPIDIKNAYNAKSNSNAQNYPPKLEIPEGVYNARFIGIGTPYMTFDRFKGCVRCGQEVPANPKGPKSKGSGMTAEGACVTCEGTGMLKVQEVAIKYELETGEMIQESANYKLSAPTQMRDGRALSASKLYTRFKVFSGETDPESIIQWANELPDDVSVPVTLIIKGDQYPKVTDVLKRFEPSVTPVKK